MGQALASEFAAARVVFEEIDATLGQNLSALMWTGSPDELNLTANAQPALLAVSIAALRVLEAETGVEVDGEVDAVAGHSLGEYSALVAAGCMKLGDAARLLRIRGDAMQEAVPVGQGAMAALLGLDLEAAQAVAREAAEGETCDVANDNGSGQVVVSGHAAAVGRAVALAPARGAKRAMLLSVSAPFHCGLMAPAAERMRESLAPIELSTPFCPVVTNVEAAPLSDPEAIRRGLVAQVTGTVRWRESVARMSRDGIDTFVEIGAGKVLTGLVKRIATGCRAASFGGPADLEAVRPLVEG